MRRQDMDLQLHVVSAPSVFASLSLGVVVAARGSGVAPSSRPPDFPVSSLRFPKTAAETIADQCRPDGGAHSPDQRGLRCHPSPLAGGRLR